MERKRDTGLDVMRFVCMFMIISLHYFSEGGVLNNNEASEINVIFGSFIVVLFRGAVNCFFLNSGYFLNSNRADISFPGSFNNVIKLYRKTWIYSIAVFVVAVVTGISFFSTGNLFRAIFPLMGNQYWYITVFMLVALLRPFVAKAATRLNDNELKLLVTILLCFDALQAALGVNVFNEQGNGVLHAITMVMLGYALQRKIVPILSRRWAVGLYFTASIILRGSGIVLNRIPEFPLSYWENLMVYNSPLVILIAYAVFCFFANIHVDYKLFTKISGSVLAAYLIQDHPMMRENFWLKVIQCGRFYNSDFMILHWLISVLLIMVVFIYIDMVIQAGVKHIKRRKVKWLNMSKLK